MVVQTIVSHFAGAPATSGKRCAKLVENMGIWKQ
jgi:hypothetical protein